MKYPLSKLSLALTAAALLSACGGSSDGNENKNVAVVPDPTPIVEETATPVVMEQAIEHVNLLEATMYYVDVVEEAPSLSISFATGLAGESLGDPDIYVRYEEEPTIGEAGEFDCISYNGSNTAELCIIDNPKPGRYYILVDAFDQGDGVGVTDGTLWASTTLFNNNKSCELPVTIRAQEMSDEEVNAACEVVSRAKVQFDAILHEGIAPEFQVPVEGDLNERTSINIFADLLNHKAWVSYLYDSANDSGIYFESEPTEFSHSSEILTFNALEWSGGRSVIRSLDHEYIHALDGRYNKEGAYKKEMSWWSEGLAEYAGTFYNLPYQRFETSIWGSTYTLADVFSSHENNNVPSPYDWGQLAVAFLIEKHPNDVTTMLSHMRAGNWDEYNALLASFVANYEGEFVSYYTTDVKMQFEESAKPLALNTYQRIDGRGGWVYSVDVSQNESSITIATTRGSGNVALMVSKDAVPHWNYSEQPQCDTYSEGNAGNEESCTFADVTPGTYYVVIDSDFVGADIVDMYVTACSGESCTVELPEPLPLVEASAPVLPVSVPLPAVGEIGSCALETAYYDKTNISATGFSVTNPTEVPVNVYWISTSGKANFSTSYATLVSGESYTADYWKQGDRLMITDKYNNCLGVGVLNSEDNEFTVSEDLVADVVELSTPEIGSCDLLVPYTATSNSASNFSITNNANIDVTLHWVAGSTGEIYFDSSYGTLANGEEFSSTQWYEGDRMALVDNDKQCLGVIDLNSANNGFVIESSLFE
jgi:hypothetical protein